MSYAVPDAIVNAIKGGATHNAEAECLVVDNAMRYCTLSGGVWSLAPSGDRITLPEFNLLAHPATSVLTEPIEYAGVISHPAGFSQFVSQGGYAKLIDP